MIEKDLALSLTPLFSSIVRFCCLVHLSLQCEPIGLLLLNLSGVL